MTKRLGMHWINQWSTGYGHLGSAMAKGLEEADVEIVPFSGPDGPPPKTKATITVSQPGATQGKWKGQTSIIVTMWESTRLPEAYVEPIDSWDIVACPSAFNVSQFSHYHPNVVQWPCGINTDDWVPSERTVLEELRFLICGAGARKGTDIAHKAFLAAFPKPDEMDPRPRLICKNHREVFGGAGVETIPTKMPLPQLLELYESCHVYVGPSRGEGWGLQPHQALATGIPAILSEIPGHVDYAAGAPGALLVPTETVKAAYFAYGEAGDWWEPDFDFLVDAYRAVYADWTGWYERAQSDAQRIRTEFGHTAMASRALATIGAKVEGPELRTKTYLGRSVRRFLLRVTRPLKPDIGSLSYDFRPGEDYWCNADTKRVVWEAGYADPDCMEYFNAQLGTFSAGRAADECERLGLSQGLR